MPLMPWFGQRDGIAAKTDELNSIPWTQKVEGENKLKQVTHSTFTYVHKIYVS